MSYTRIPCTFMRGGTSNALVFRRGDLPNDESRWPAIFLAAMGSPDPNKRQLDGMGGGISSLSKVCVVGPPSRPDADVDYSFYQIGVADEIVDASGNCGNMSSAMGPFAFDEGMTQGADREAAVRIHNTNTGKIIVSRFEVRDGTAAVSGGQAIDGVSGTAAPIRLEFLDPGGAGTGHLQPANGEAESVLDVPGIGRVTVSMVDAANPCVFLEPAAVGKTGTEHPEALEADEDFMTAMEGIRRAASVAMGIAATPEAAGGIPSIPKVAMVFAPTDYTLLSGRTMPADAFDIGVRMISIGNPHRAVPLTGGLCLGVAARLPGSLPARIARQREASLRIGHPSGLLEVDAEIEDRDGTPHAVHGAVIRTARRLFEGHVLIPN
ncbi:PrpF domain-containing protein [Roseicyclus sp. F158]|uniref:PrpF domain-containing protein n=1 Tax=Tropicimonas omnivorans TaxID=3075590 RepID=A0ABU3DI16_9RHOB|nr:PrpF domain-containing protein [Roseicyclus sp. F158]MDT0683348.1 PrpF domain-containing protein [Roseicyclus sp. F158]